MVYKKLKEVPKGKVTTYKYLARAAGNEKAVRAVGNIMNKNPFAPEVPCHRVVQSDGSIGGFAHGSQQKKKMLVSEGVMFNGNKIQNFNDIVYVLKK